MAYNQFDVPATTVALVAAAATSLIGSKAATNVCVEVLNVGMSFDGATSSNAPAVCAFMQSTFGANAPGTNSTTVTPPKRDTGRAETIQSTHAKLWSTEPTTLAVQQVIDLGQFNGTAMIMYPFASPFIIIGGQGCVLRVTSPNNVNFSGSLGERE